MGINEGFIDETFLRLRGGFLVDFLVGVRRLFVGGIDKSNDFD